METPKSLNDVQKLNGRLIALGRFISCSAKKALPFFRLLKKQHPFRWETECEFAFQAIKSFLTTPPLLSVPTEGEQLYLYITTCSDTMSSVLVRETDEVLPIYYYSRILHDAEKRYSLIEKTVYAIVQSSNRLRPYFQAH